MRTSLPLSNRTSHDRYSCHSWCTPLLRNLSVVSLSHICFHGSVKSGSCYNNRPKGKVESKSNKCIARRGARAQAGMSIWHCSNSPMVRSPKTQWKPNPNFFPLKAKRSFEGREKPVNITRSEQKTINSRIAFQITRHLGLSTGRLG